MQQLHSKRKHKYLIFKGLKQDCVIFWRKDDQSLITLSKVTRHKLFFLIKIEYRSFIYFKLKLIIYFFLSSDKFRTFLKLKFSLCPLILLHSQKKLPRVASFLHHCCYKVAPIAALTSKLSKLDILGRIFSLEFKLKEINRLY